MARSLPPTMVPDELYGKYRLVERIASGGMAEVFKAVAMGEAGFEKPVAIKRLHRHLSEDEDLVAMLQDEARLCSGLNHGNICQVLDLGRVGETYYIAMEYVDGKDLFHILRTASRTENPLPQAAALHIACEMLAGLDYAHRKRDPDGRLLHIIHRDISPQNVLITWDGQVKIIDFGIAKARTSTHRTQAGVIKGKFRYMSPEQARGEPIDHRTDIFAAGVVLYEMISGQPHSVGATDREVLIKIQTGRFERLGTLVPGLDPALEELVHRALAVEPAHRYASARAFRKALLAYARQTGQVFGRDDLAEYVSALFEHTPAVLEHTGPLRAAAPEPTGSLQAAPPAPDPFGAPEVDPFSIRARLPVPDLAPATPGPPAAPAAPAAPPPPARGHRASRQKPTVALDTPGPHRGGPAPSGRRASRQKPTVALDTPGPHRGGPALRPATPPGSVDDYGPADRTAQMRPAQLRRPAAPADIPRAEEAAPARGRPGPARRRGAWLATLGRGVVTLAVLAGLAMGGYKAYRVYGPRLGLGAAGAGKSGTAGSGQRHRRPRQVKASFFFDSRPHKARIFLNGQDIHQVTPARLTLTVPTRLQVTLRHRRFKTPWTRTIPVASGDEVVLVADLRNPPTVGRRPARARRGGRGRLRVRRAAGRRAQVSKENTAALVPDIADEARLRVTCDHKGARVIINGVDRGATPLTRRVRPTTFTVEVRAGSRRSDRRTITLKPGEIRRMHFQLGP